MISRFVFKIIVFACVFGLAETRASTGETSVATWKNNFSGAVSLTIDDTGYDRVDTLGILDDYGVKGTFFLNTGILSQSSFLQNVFQSASQNGHEIGSHTVSHPDLVTLSDAQLDFELDTAQQYLETLTGKPVVSLAYPFGSDDARVRQAVGQRHLAARDVYPDAIHPATGQNMLRLGEALGPFNWTDAEFIQERLAFATEAETTGGWAIEMYHNLAAPGSSNSELFHTEAALRGHLANLTSGNLSVWIAPMGDVARYYLSREGTQVSVDASQPDQLTVGLNLTDPTGRIATPLTITTEVPGGWDPAQLQVEQDSSALTFATEVTNSGLLVTYDAVPNLGDVTISVPSVAFAGDYNDDGFVDAADYTVWRDNLGSSNSLGGNGDETGGSAGIVDAADYDLWVLSYGNTPVALSTTVTVPEPSTLLLALAYIGVVASRQGRND